MDHTLESIGRLIRSTRKALGVTQRYLPQDQYIGRQVHVKLERLLGHLPVE